MKLRLEPLQRLLVRVATLPEHASDVTLDAPLVTRLGKEAAILSSHLMAERIASDSNSPEVSAAIERCSLRLSRRPIPSGISAAVGLGRFGPSSVLEIGDPLAFRRGAHCDAGALWMHAAKLAREASVRTELTYRVNRSLFVIGDAARLMARSGDRKPSEAVTVELDDHLTLLLKIVGEGSWSYTKLVELCIEAFEVSRAEATDYVDGLIEAEVFMPTSLPSIFDIETTSWIEAALHRDASSVLTTPLSAIRRAIEAVDATPLSQDASLPLLELAKATRPLGDEDFVAHRVDLAAHNLPTVLDRSLAASLRDVTAFMLRMSSLRGEGARFKRFIERFSERYEDRAVALLEVLDPGVGLGELEPEPLTARNSCTDQLVALNVEALACGTDVDLGKLDVSAAPDVDSSAVAVLFTLAEGRSISAAAPATVIFKPGLVVGGIVTAGARFTRHQEDVHGFLREAADREQESSDAILAEIACFPPARVANLAARRTIRRVVIDCEGSIVPEGDLDVIMLRDLLIRCERGKLRLWSIRHGREVIPMRSSVANVSSFTRHPIAEFLEQLSLQYQLTIGVSATPTDRWPYRPRWWYRDVLVARRRWYLPQSMLAKSDSEAAFESFRERLRVPRHVVHAVEDYFHDIDLDDPRDRAAVLKRSQENGAVLEEKIDTAVVRSPYGRHRAEFVASFVFQKSSADTPSRHLDPTRGSGAPMRRKAPGSEVVYLKAYTDPQNAKAVIARLMKQAHKLERRGGATHAFFIRYADPDPHVRFRAFFASAEHAARATKRLLRAATSDHTDARVWRVQLDTYEREVERYGGEAGIELVERLFALDSLASAETTGSLALNAVERRYIVAHSAMRYLRHLELSAELQRDFLRKIVAGYREELGREVIEEGSRWFTEARDEWLAIAAGERSESSLIYETIYAREVTLFRELLELELRGVLSKSRSEIVQSLIHLSAARVFDTFELRLREGQTLAALCRAVDCNLHLAKRM